MNINVLVRIVVARCIEDASAAVTPNTRTTGQEVLRSLGVLAALEKLSGLVMTKGVNRLHA